MVSRKTLVHIIDLGAWMCILGACCSKEDQNLKHELTQATIQKELQIIKKIIFTKTFYYR